MQIERSSTFHNQPPLLPITNLKTFFNKLHNERDSLYEKMAKFSITSDDSALDEHALRIANILLDDKSTKQRAEKLIVDEKDLTFFHKNLHTPIHLSEQQAICLKLLAQGKTSKEIALEINISYRTVEGYIAKTMEQLGCSNSKELIALYFDKP